MTVIKDPGNQTESYSDAAVRMWRETAGLWRGDARDTSGSTHPPGWVSGQLWSVTASQWQSSYNSSQSALATMTADRDLWQSRANQAYTGGVWGSGILWSTEAANRLAAGSGSTPASGRASGSFSGGGGGNGNYADITLAGQTNNVLTFWSGSVCVAPIAGVYHISARRRGNAQNSGQQVGLRMLKNGAGFSPTFGTTDAIGQPDSGSGGSAFADIGISCTATLAASDQIKLQSYQSFGFAAGVDVFEMVFIPTPNNPH